MLKLPWPVGPRPLLLNATVLISVNDLPLCSIWHSDSSLKPPLPWFLWPHSFLGFPEALYFLLASLKHWYSHTSYLWLRKFLFTLLIFIGCSLTSVHFYHSSWLYSFSKYYWMPTLSVSVWFLSQNWQPGFLLILRPHIKLPSELHVCRTFIDVYFRLCFLRWRFRCKWFIKGILFRKPF